MNSCNEDNSDKYEAQDCNENIENTSKCDENLSYHNVKIPDKSIKHVETCIDKKSCLTTKPKSNSCASKSIISKFDMLNHSRISLLDEYKSNISDHIASIDDKSSITGPFKMEQSKCPSENDFGSLENLNAKEDYKSIPSQIYSIKNDK
ncbi:uncharacterized protein LOC111631842 [Centruroides sculpturatus]|uniref:uncharacterized protein LOC111631842 n=1 Tax=Centruroides sculpturatus TaxID=218467 RepID=UPI000C6E085E|nr:uncharacterized protein LOC111631842 [Centruroides sculpturatus]XP_023231935.1 uncharacterized protein LOC111631842 [Centruroides sculpturatus]